MRPPPACWMPATGLWAADILAALRPSGRICSRRWCRPGTVLGELTERSSRKTGVHRPLQVTTVGSHDTASAVVGVPAADGTSATFPAGPGVSWASNWTIRC